MGETHPLHLAETPPPAPFDDAERLARLRLIRSENVGPVTFRRLVGRFGSAVAALDALPHLARRGGRRHVRLCPLAEAEAETARLTDAGGRWVALGETDYPPLLAEIEDAPPLLAVIGAADVLRHRAVAVVGARNASLNGQKLARGLAADLGAAGLVVVSGLARGIDAAAHQGALKSGTVAVLGGGVDVVYPRENELLYAAIAADGALVSEMSPGTTPQRSHFPRRNRVISGMAWGVLVVEAGLHSGSLITARLALDQGREVFAVPGSPLDPRARGTNHLIRQGAILTESADDILAQIDAMLDPPRIKESAPFTPPAPAPPAAESEVDSVRDAILSCLGPVPVTVDELIRNRQFSPSVVSVALLELELAGRLERHPGNRVSLLPHATDT